MFNKNAATNKFAGFKLNTSTNTSNNAKPLTQATIRKRQNIFNDDDEDDNDNDHGDINGNSESTSIQPPVPRPAVIALGGISTASDRASPNTTNHSIVSIEPVNSGTTPPPGAASIVSLAHGGSVPPPPASAATSSTPNPSLNRSGSEATFIDDVDEQEEEAISQIQRLPVRSVPTFNISSKKPLFNLKNTTAPVAAPVGGSNLAQSKTTSDQPSFSSTPALVEPDEKELKRQKKEMYRQLGKQQQQQQQQQEQQQLQQQQQESNLDDLIPADWPRGDGVFEFHIWGFGDDVTVKMVEDLFKPTFPSFLKARICFDRQGISKQYGFVCFSNGLEMAKAFTQMNGVWCGERKLFIKKSHVQDMKTNKTNAHLRYAKGKHR